MQAMKGATMALGSMNKSMNLPQLQRIAMEFERENDIMEQRQEMMDDAVDDAMDVGVEEEGDEVVEQVLEEIGIDLSQAVRTFWNQHRHSHRQLTCLIFLLARRHAHSTRESCTDREQDCSSRWWRRWWRQWRSSGRRFAGKAGQPQEISECDSVA